MEDEVLIISPVKSVPFAKRRNLEVLRSQGIANRNTTMATSCNFEVPWSNSELKTWLTLEECIIKPGALDLECR